MSGRYRRKFCGAEVGGEEILGRSADRIGASGGDRNKATIGESHMPPVLSTLE